MKKISPFGLYLSLLVVKEGTDINHSQVLILLLVTIIFIVIFGLAVLLIVWRLIRIGRAYFAFISCRWTEDPDIHSRKVQETDLNLAMFTEQQWPLSELFSQGHEDGDGHDFVDLPHDW